MRSLVIEIILCRIDVLVYAVQIVQLILWLWIYIHVYMSGVSGDIECGTF